MRVKKIEAKKPVLVQRKKVAAYARVSCETEKLAHSLSAQISYYSELIQKNPEWEFVGVYADNFLSGTKAGNRKELQRLIADCESGKVDIVLTKSISRFARNVVDLLNFVRRLKDIGVSVRFEKENIDSLTADGEVMLSILAGFAEEESKSISTNMKWSIRKKYEQGGSSHVPAFGYRWNGETFIINKEQAQEVRRIYDAFLNDMPIRAIAKMANADGFPNLSNFGVTYMLQNEVYKGDLILQKYYVDEFRMRRNKGELPRYYVSDNHEAIISVEQWQAVQDKIKASQEYNPTVHRMVKPSCFSGKIICCRCGHKYVKDVTHGAKADGLLESWKCFGKKKYKKDFCSGLGIRGDRLREAAAKAMGLAEFDDIAFTKQVEKIVTTLGDSLEFHFYDGTVKEVPIKLYRQNHMSTDDPHQKFPGYTWTKDGYVIVPEEAEMVRMIYQLYAEGKKIVDIRDEVERAGYRSYRGGVSVEFITKILDDERYCGRRTIKGQFTESGKDETIENDHEPIIDMHIFNKVKERRAYSRERRRR